MTTKYRLKEKIPFTDYEVGHEFEVSEKRVRSAIFYKELGYGYNNLTISPHEILMMLKLGILEEIKEEEYDGHGWLPKEGEKYWYPKIHIERVDFETWTGEELFDKKVRKLVGVYRTESEAEVALGKILSALARKK